MAANITPSKCRNMVLKLEHQNLLLLHQHLMSANTSANYSTSLRWSHELIMHTHNQLWEMFTKISADLKLNVCSKHFALLRVRSLKEIPMQTTEYSLYFLYDGSFVRLCCDTDFNYSKEIRTQDFYLSAGANNHILSFHLTGPLQPKMILVK